MRKTLPLVGMSISGLALVWCVNASAQNQTKFQDVPDTHWAYQAVTDLQEKGILIGYPDGYFRGKRTLTRYEFAVALERALKTIGTTTPGQGPQGPPGAQGEQGPPGPPGPPGMTPDEVAELKRLTDEFKSELASLGANVKDINNRLDQLAKDVADLKSRLDHMLVLGGDLFTGFRSDRSRYGFFDYSGAGRMANPDHFTNVDAVHDWHLVANANLAGDVHFKGDLFSSNYLGYRTAAGEDLGGPSAANPNPNTEQVGVYEAELDIPIHGIGNGTTLTLGRFKNKLTPLTYWRPDTDAYFYLPWYDDGSFVEDGFKLATKFGSATTSLWAGSYSDLTTTGGTFLNRPVVGANFGPRLVFGSFKPFDFLGVDRGAIFANQSAGFHLGVPLFKFGELGASLMDFTESGALAVGPAFGPPFHNVVVYAGNLNLRNFGRFHFTAEGAKSVDQLTLEKGAPGNSNNDDNAGVARLTYGTGPLHTEIGYQYIDPRFGAPGYWNKIGNWYDPTNVKGPFGRLAYRFSRSIHLHLGGDFYDGARSRRGAVPGTGLSYGDSIIRGEGGIRWNATRKLNVDVDYEGVFWQLTAASSASGHTAKPVEQYLTIGTGLNLAPNTVLKMAYQMIDVRDVGGGFGGIPNFPIGEGGGLVPGGVSNASVFTTQVAVHF